MKDFFGWVLSAAQVFVAVWLFLLAIDTTNDTGTRVVAAIFLAGGSLERALSRRLDYLALLFEGQRQS